MEDLAIYALVDTTPSFGGHVLLHPTNKTIAEIYVSWKLSYSMTLAWILNKNRFSAMLDERTMELKGLCRRCASILGAAYLKCGCPAS